jgi:leucyl/phenylalanyl-tRNA--protein transferase
MSVINYQELLYAYINGIFPMADADGSIYWYAPDPRAIIPLDTYKPSKSLKPVLNRKSFDVRLNDDFEGVIRNCAKPRNDSEETWISEDLILSYIELHRQGFAHSIECYQNNELVGGLYGVCIGGAFFGESMFSAVSNSSKVAFHYLILNLRRQNFGLLDSQFINDNVKRYGAIEIPKKTYEKLLNKALRIDTSLSPIVFKEIYSA